MGNSLVEIYGRAPRMKFVQGEAEFKLLLPEQLMGVEIEVERTRNSHLPSTSEAGAAWTVKTDGSLVDGREYVLSSPMAGDALAHAITTFFRTARLEARSTSSTHIHLDMSEDSTTLSVLQVVFALVYMLEPVLWHVGDPSRKWCGFTHAINTLPSDVLGQLYAENFTVNSENFADQTRCISRYYGLNMNALYKYGSLEFRYFPTATSAEQLSNWINLVQSFKKAGLEIDNMRALAAMMESSHGYEQLITNQFADWSEQILSLVPYHAASTAFYELTECWNGVKAETRGRSSINYGRVLQTNAGFGKIAKKRKVKRMEPEEVEELASCANIERYMTNNSIPSLVMDGTTVVAYGVRARARPESLNEVVVLGSSVYVAGLLMEGMLQWVEVTSGPDVFWNTGTQMNTSTLRFVHSNLTRLTSITEQQRQRAVARLTSRL